MLNRLLQQFLRLAARAILARYHPTVVGITGSVGKTSAKEAIVAVLAPTRRVRGSTKSYNNELGLPLTIIGAEAPGRSFVRVLDIVARVVRLLLWRNRSYPEVLVLEMGADRPGDLAYLTAIAPGNVGVLTAIAPVHLERFHTIEGVAKEKRQLLTGLSAGGVAVFNADDELVAATTLPVGVRGITYGFSSGAAVRASDVVSHGDPSAAGLSFKVTHAGSTVPIHLPNAIGQPVVYAALAGIAVGLSFDLNLVAIASALRTYQVPPGRMRLLPGKNGTLLIDDTYNASPLATLAALDALSAMPVQGSGRRYAVLGDMLELGNYAQAGHEVVGAAMAKQGIDVLVAVGELAQHIARAARLGGMKPEAVFSFTVAEEAARFLNEQRQPGDVVLVKGSQGARLERVVEAIMVEPNRVAELLVRQDESWQKKP